MQSYKVKLLKNYVSRGGNLYPPGIYEPNVLPEACLLDSTLSVTLAETDSLVTKKLKPALETVDFSSDQEKKRRAAVETEISPTVTEVVPQKNFINTEALEINLSNKTDLINLKGIGNTTAKKIIEARELSPFLSMSDLAERIDLPFKGDWKSYRISFETE